MLSSSKNKHYYVIIKNDIVLEKNMDDEELMFYRLGESKIHNEPIYFRYPIANEWCKENGIDPLNMTDEDMMAFKLRFL